MDLLLEFKKYILLHNLFHPKDKLLLAVSGGVDSVVLCELCRQAGFDFIIAHCNFQLRGAESERDEEFVKALGIRYGVETWVRKFETETYAKEKKLSIQVAARELRYRWFDELLSQHSRLPIHHSTLTTQHSPLTIHLLTAHHIDDNIETMLMNFFKGTGIAGLRGILPKQGKIVRPLLFARKEELLTFAKENNLSWVVDSSNESDKYSRNYFRHHLIPMVQKIFPEAENNLADNLPRFRDIELLYQQSIDQHKKKLIAPKGNEIHIPVLKLKKSEPLHSIVFEIIKDFGFHAAQVHEVIDLLDSDTGKYVASASHRVIKNRNWLIIAPVVAAEATTILLEEPVKLVEFAAGRLQFDQLTAHSSVPDSYRRSPQYAMLDSGKIKFPIILRKWKTGDYFYPLGMKNKPSGGPGKKKLSRFFIDQKLSRTDKEKIWVLEMDQKIIWVIGHRVDDRFKITDKTKRILEVVFSQT
ncbi:MAG: tilS [Chitinophagaceae bacterium]|nr:tilS [Chitinophagaceae bacterium]